MEITKQNLVVIANNGEDVDYNRRYWDTNPPTDELGKYLVQFLNYISHSANPRYRSFNLQFNPVCIKNENERLSSKEIDTKSILINKPSDLVFFPYDKEFDYSLFKQYASEISSRYNSSDRAAIDWYKAQVSATPHEQVSVATFSTFNYIWEENKTLHISNIGSIPIEKLDPIDITSLIEQDSTNEIFNQSFNMIGTKKHINCLTSQQVEKIASLPLGKKVKMYNLKNLYRGTTDTTFDLQLKNINAFKKGYKIILLKAKVDLIPSQGFDHLTDGSYSYFFVTNVSIAHFSKYKKCKKFFAHFYSKMCAYEGAFFFDKEKYKEKMKQRFGSNTLYSSAIQEIFKDSNDSLTKVKMNPNVKPTSFDPSIFSIYSTVKKAKSIPQYSSYVKTKKKAKEFEIKVNDLERKKTTIDRDITNLEQRVVNLQEELERKKSDLSEKQKTKKEITVNLPNYKEAYTSLSQSMVEKQKAYNTYLEQITKQDILSTENPYAKNFLKKGIIVDRIEYTVENEPGIKTLEKDPMVILQSLKTDAKINFKKVCFRIIKPVTIYVDRAEKGEDCKKIVGGPYLVEVNSDNNLDISLLTSASIFGYDHTSQNAWIHPHTSAFTTRSCNTVESFCNTLLNNTKRACLGEAGPAIHSAFKEKDIRQVIIATMSWITNANSSDAWGKHYKYFPALESLKNSDVSMTREFISNQNITDQMQDPNEIFNLFSDSLEEEELQIEQEEIQQVQQEPQEEVIQFALRRPGVQNYSPYNPPSQDTQHETP